MQKALRDKSKGIRESLFSDSSVQNIFHFQTPARIEIKSTVSGVKNYCVLTENEWRWVYGGIPYDIKWENYSFDLNLKNILKAFLYSRFLRLSPKTIGACDLRFVKFLSLSEYGHKFPWKNELDILTLTTEVIQYDAHAIYGLKAFYRFGIANQITGFENSFSSIIEDSKANNKHKQYSKVLLNEINMLSAEDENLLLEKLSTPINISNYIEFRNNVIFHLAFELAPRPIQIHSLSIEDMDEVISASTNEDYFSLWLPMAKKIGTNKVEKRVRKITNQLGQKISTLIEENKRFFLNTPLSPIFINPTRLSNGKSADPRLNVREISSIILEEMKQLGFGKGDGATLLRHHLAQSLADQGASAETIAEILGHNSTVPARAYIAATPAIAEIKTRALGKNETYSNIMKMLLTGDIISKAGSIKERWVKGMIGSQYIGGIGVCGLSPDTSCPKNPVYACYTCKKFQPFREGIHNEVKEQLQKQVQYFVDIAEKGIALDHNRTVSQLERTIEAVDATIDRINSIQ
ncbi:MAG: site-specific integrase [Sediminibacterium sp.]|nr:site-specific integrase [Sediminibacterium sp.]